jgi:hypothetical protein
MHEEFALQGGGDEKLSAIALSRAVPVLPIEGTMPPTSSRCLPKEIAVCTGRRDRNDDPRVLRMACASIYKSQRENKTHRALRRAQNTRERLGGSGSMVEPFPERPKGLRHETYERLHEEHREAELEQLVGMKEWLEKLG